MFKAIFFKKQFRIIEKCFNCRIRADLGRERNLLHYLSRSIILHPTQYGSALGASDIKTKYIHNSVINNQTDIIWKEVTLYFPNSLFQLYSISSADICHIRQQPYLLLVDVKSFLNQ